MSLSRPKQQARLELAHQVLEALGKDNVLHPQQGEPIYSSRKKVTDFVFTVIDSQVDTQMDTVKNIQWELWKSLEKEEKYGREREWEEVRRGMKSKRERKKGTSLFVLSVTRRAGLGALAWFCMIQKPLNLRLESPIHWPKTNQWSPFGIIIRN